MFIHTFAEHKKKKQDKILANKTKISLLSFIYYETKHGNSKKNYANKFESNTYLAQMLINRSNYSLKNADFFVQQTNADSIMFNETHSYVTLLIVNRFLLHPANSEY